MTDPRPLARQVGLLIVTFVATLAILTGLLAVVSARKAPAVGTPSAPAVVVGAGGEAVLPTPSPASVTGSSSGEPTAATDPVLAGAGEIGECGPSGDEETAKLLDAIGGTVFTAGNNAYPNGTAGQYAMCYGTSWGRFESRTRPAVGNVDYQTEGALGYLGYFGPAATNGEGKTWYSYDLGRWHVVVLDSTCSKIGGCDSASPEGRWLTADLAATHARCTVAIWNQPRFSSGEHGNDLEVEPFWQALYAAGAEIVVNAHDHDYERFKPQTPAGGVDIEKGIREFVVGTGGTPLGTFGPSKPNSDIRASVSPGVLKLTLHPAGYDWQFIPTTGAFSDSGSAPCH
jgi:acid phosphatase type 7